MTPNEALDELLALSSQVEEVAILGGSGFVLACTGSPERGERLARVALDLLAAAAAVRPSEGEVTRIQVPLGDTSVFVVSEGGRTALATTVPEPTAGLVVYDLRTALRRLEEASAVPDAASSPPKPRRTRKERTGDA